MNLLWMKNKLVCIFLLICISPGTGMASQDTSTWNDIQSKGVLTIGVTQAPPWFFKTGSGTWSGLGVKVGNAMAATLGVKLKIVETTWKSSVADIQNGKIDVMFVLDPTPERAMLIDFPSQDMLYYALGILADKRIRARQWSQLNNDVFHIGVVAGTIPDQFVTHHLPKANITRYRSTEEVKEAFKAMQVDAVCIYHPALISILKEANRGKIILPDPIRASATSAGVRRENDKAWRDWVSTTLNYYYNTGQTQAWFEESLRELGVDPFGVPTISREHW